MTIGLGLNLFILTWNLCKKDGTNEEFGTLLNLPPPPGVPLPDLYIIGLQEMPYFMPILRKADWMTVFDSVLSSHGYSKVASERLPWLWGVSVQVFVLDKHLEAVKFVETDKVRAGLFHRTLGNKGGSGVRLHIHNIPICFVSSHLTALEAGYADRIDQLPYIKKKLKFTQSEIETVFENDVVFWFGDLNFRLQADLNLETKQIVQKINDNEFKHLLKYDEINALMSQGIFFNDMKEAEIQFAPTYKFLPGSDTYDEGRRPAWTDRILYKTKNGVDVTPVSYTSHPERKLSDHKPVVGVFQVRVVGERIKKIKITK